MINQSSSYKEFQFPNINEYTEVLDESSLVESDLHCMILKNASSALMFAYLQPCTMQLSILYASHLKLRFSWCTDKQRETKVWSAKARSHHHTASEKTRVHFQQILQLQSAVYSDNESLS